MRKIEYPMINYSCFFLSILEPRITYYASTMFVRNLLPEDLAQELRLCIWKDLDKYNPYRSGIITWGNLRIKSKIWDLTNPNKYKRDQLDQDGRSFLPL